ncbi:MAG: hypothetical protein WDN25_22100 [Acetobacteraceae bacterium]
MRRIPHLLLRALLILFATVYFLIDVLFLSAIRPLRRRLMGLRLAQRLRKWVSGLNRYAALALLAVPWALLEPLKPIGLYLFAHHRHTSATVLIVIGEIVKLTLLDQIFDMTKPKLLTFPWFAWGYARWEAVLARLRSLPLWQRIVYRYRMARAWVVSWL